MIYAEGLQKSKLSLNLYQVQGWGQLHVNVINYNYNYFCSHKG